MDKHHIRNWKAFAEKVWPEIDATSRFEAGKMDEILQKMEEEHRTTDKLFQTLIEIERRDVIEELQKEYPSLR